MKGKQWKDIGKRQRNCIFPRKVSTDSMQGYGRSGTPASADRRTELLLSIHKG